MFSRKLIQFTDVSIYTFISPTENKVQKIEDADSFFPSTVIKSFKTLVNLGFLDLKEDNKIIFYPEQLSKKEFNSYSLATIRNGYADIFLDVNIVNKNKIGLYATYTEALDNVDLSSLRKVMRARFKEHRFTPENGWEFMYYLDLITKWEHSWNEDEIRTLDSCKTQGLSMNTVKVMVEKNIPVQEMKNAIGLPLTWVEHIYGISDIANSY